MTTVRGSGVSDGPSRASGGRSFEPGDLVGERYRIVRFIARGGMGEVYEAEDTALQGKVALKTVRPEIAAGSRGIERFKREILVARQITHPNVCRVFDLGFHKDTGASSGGDGMLFLTMELLGGETLADRIARGRLSAEEAPPIAEQLASALAAAHGAGIIHRDFKSANVMLVEESRGGMRAVVTDFGLARACASEDSGTGTLTEVGTVTGTPAYMAPEQVEGKTLTPAADIYALGIVLYEMVTGVRPFDGGSPMSIAAQRLTQDPAPPSKHVPQIDPLWETAILRCLQRDPAARYGSALQITQALRGVSGEITRTLLAPSMPATKRVSAIPVRAFVRPLAALLATVGYFALLEAVRRTFFFFVPMPHYLATVGWPQVLPLLLLLVPGVRRGLVRLLVDRDGRVRRATVGGAAALVLAAGGAGVALQPAVELAVDSSSIDTDDPTRPPFDNVTAATVRGDNVCHSIEEQNDPDRRCDAAVPASGHLRLHVRLGMNTLASPRLKLVAGPAGAVAFARARLDPALAVALGDEQVRSVGSTLEVAGGAGRTLRGAFDVRLVLRELPGEIAEPQLRLTLTQDMEGSHAQPQLERCWSLVEGHMGAPCRDPDPGAGS